MKKKIIENTLKFLQRTDLKGNEVPAFVECVNYLTSSLKEEEPSEIVGDINI